MKVSGIKLLRYIKNHENCTTQQIARDLYQGDLKSCHESLKLMGTYLIRSDLSDGKFRDVNQRSSGPAAYSISPTGLDYLNERMSVEVKFWLSLTISVIALIVSIIRGTPIPAV